MHLTPQGNTLFERFKTDCKDLLKNNAAVSEFTRLQLGAAIQIADILIDGVYLSDNLSWSNFTKVLRNGLGALRDNPKIIELQQHLKIIDNNSSTWAPAIADSAGVEFSQLAETLTNDISQHKFTDYFAFDRGEETLVTKFFKIDKITDIFKMLANNIRTEREIYILLSQTENAAKDYARERQNIAQQRQVFQTEISSSFTVENYSEFTKKYQRFVDKQFEQLKYHQYMSVALTNWSAGSGEPLDFNPANSSPTLYRQTLIRDLLELELALNQLLVAANVAPLSHVSEILQSNYQAHLHTLFLENLNAKIDAFLLQCSDYTKTANSGNAWKSMLLIELAVKIKEEQLRLNYSKNMAAFCEIQDKFAANLTENASDDEARQISDIKLHFTNLKTLLELPACQDTPLSQGIAMLETYLATDNLTELRAYQVYIKQWLHHALTDSTPLWLLNMLNATVTAAEEHNTKCLKFRCGLGKAGTILSSFKNELFQLLQTLNETNDPKILILLHRHKTDCVKLREQLALNQAQAGPLLSSHDRTETPAGSPLSGSDNPMTDEDSESLSFYDCLTASDDEDNKDVDENRTVPDVTAAPLPEKTNHSDSPSTAQHDSESSLPSNNHESSSAATAASLPESYFWTFPAGYSGLLEDLEPDYEQSSIPDNWHYSPASNSHARSSSATAAPLPELTNHSDPPSTAQHDSESSLPSNNHESSSAATAAPLPESTYAVTYTGVYSGLLENLDPNQDPALLPRPHASGWERVISRKDLANFEKLLNHIGNFFRKAAEIFHSAFSSSACAFYDSYKADHAVDPYIPISICVR